MTYIEGIKLLEEYLDVLKVKSIIRKYIYFFVNM